MVSPAEQKAAQLPFEQTSVAAQAWLQEPQFAASFCSLTQAPLQAFWPAGQMTWQVPEEQTWPAPQTVPQAPQ